MKPFKAAVVAAGSLAVAVVAAPAVAQDASDLTPSSLNGALDTLTHQQTLDVRPVQHQSDALDTENEDSVFHTVKSAAATLNRGGGPTRLLGGLPLQRG